MRKVTQIPYRNVFDIIVVGNGMMGSAASKYLSYSGRKVACIESQRNYAVESCSDVFSSHNDVSRVQRLIDKDAIWSTLNIESGKEYHKIQSMSGVRFLHECGCLYVSTYSNDKYLSDSLPSQLPIFDPSVRGNGCILSREYLRTAFPLFVFPDNAEGYIEYSPAGVLNPIKLIQAQTTLFQRNGGVPIKGTALSVDESSGLYVVKTANGETYASEKVLLAPGAFVNFMDLLPADKKLDVVLKGETVLLVEVSGTEAARLQSLPSLLYEVDTGEAEGVYLTPPASYAELGNNQFFLKMGCNLASDRFLGTLSEVQQWFRHGHAAFSKCSEDAKSADTLRRTLHNILPTLTGRSYMTKRCIITRTPNRRQYIGSVDGKGLFVATGGNGYSAMCSNELGRVAAHVVESGQQALFPYHSTDFEPVFI